MNIIKKDIISKLHVGVLIFC